VPNKLHEKTDKEAIQAVKLNLPCPRCHRKDCRCGPKAPKERKVPEKEVKEARWLPQTRMGGIDKLSTKTQKDMWKGIIERVRNQLPQEFRQLQYVGPLPPTDAPLFSRKRSETVQRAHLYFGKHKHNPEGRIEVDIGRRGRHDWKVISISMNESHLQEWRASTMTNTRTGQCVGTRCGETPEEKKARHAKWRAENKAASKRQVAPTSIAAKRNIPTFQQHYWQSKKLK